MISILVFIFFLSSCGQINNHSLKTKTSYGCWEADIKKIQSNIGYKFNNTLILEEALSNHRYKNRSLMGDSLLNYVITQEASRRFSGKKDSLLDNFRQNHICNKYLREVALKIGICGTKKAKDGEYGNVMEAIFWSIAEDSSTNKAQKVILNLFGLSEKKEIQMSKTHKKEIKNKSNSNVKRQSINTMKETKIKDKIEAQKKNQTAFMPKFIRTALSNVTSNEPIIRLYDFIKLPEQRALEKEFGKYPTLLMSIEAFNVKENIALFSMDNPNIFKIAYNRWLINQKKISKMVIEINRSEVSNLNEGNENVALDNNPLVSSFIISKLEELTDFKLAFQNLKSLNNRYSDNLTLFLHLFLKLSPQFFYSPSSYPDGYKIYVCFLPIHSSESFQSKIKRKDKTKMLYYNNNNVMDHIMDSIAIQLDQFILEASKEVNSYGSIFNSFIRFLWNQDY